MTADQMVLEAATTAIGLLAARRISVGTAESLTGGLVAAALTSVPGASAVVRGGIVAYAADVKASLLGVPADLLQRVGTVHPEVAVAMAQGAASRLRADAVIATTGVAGPDPVDGHAVGTVHVAVIVPGAARGSGLAAWGTDGTARLVVGSGVRVMQRALALRGDRGQIRQETVGHALSLLVTALLEENA